MLSKVGGERVVVVGKQDVGARKGCFSISSEDSKGPTSLFQKASPTVPDSLSAKSGTATKHSQAPAVDS